MSIFVNYDGDYLRINPRDSNWIQKLKIGNNVWRDYIRAPSLNNVVDLIVDEDNNLLGLFEDGRIWDFTNERTIYV